MTWKPVVGYEGLYEVSDRGEVRSLARRVAHAFSGYITIKPRTLKANVDPPPGLPYHYVFLSKDGKPRRFRIHTLVLTMFAGPCPDDMECRHLNGNPGDNRWPENLTWGTHTENTADVIRHGGTQLRNFKLTQKQATEIKLLCGHLTQEEIGKKYGVSQATVSLIHRGETWTN
jgi:hypothetical protein